MVEPNGFSNNGSHRGRVHLLRRVAAWAGILLALGLAASASLAVSAGAANDGGHQVSGGGKTVIEGGGPGLVPVTTVLAFHANAQGGAFECLAVMPPVATSFSPESGDFEVNAMYVTGKVTSMTVRDRTAVLHGTATGTCLGDGANPPFTFVAQAGGPGTNPTPTVP